MNWNSNMEVQGGEVSLLPIETLETRLMCVLLRDCMKNRTIRGVPLTEFIEGLKENIGGIQIYIVGGAPRDILGGGGKVNDIDFVVNAGYYEIRQAIWTKLTAYNALSKISDSHLRRLYTMLSISETIQQGKREDTIDIGPLKGCLVPQRLRGHDTPYYTSCSSVSCDSKSRDFTVNSIYVDVINWKVFDPLGGFKLLSVQNKIVLQTCWDTPLINGSKYDPQLFPVKVVDYKDIGGWMRGLRFSREQKYDVKCFPDIIGKLTNYVKGLIDEVLKLKEQENEKSTNIDVKNLIDTIEKYFYKLFTKLWKKNNDENPTIEDMQRLAESLRFEVKYQNTPWLRHTSYLAYLVRDVAYSQSTDKRPSCVRAGIWKLSESFIESRNESYNKEWRVPYKLLLLPCCSRTDPFLIIQKLAWQAEQENCKCLITFKEKHKENYLAQFLNELSSSVENQARQKLGDFWDEIIHSEQFNNSALWEKTHVFGLLWKAWNHLTLVEPFDEAAHIKNNKNLGLNGGYWNTLNRLPRYTKIEEKILACYGTEYRTKEQIFHEMYPNGIPHDCLLSPYLGDLSNKGNIFK
eukprot:TRINITY_DN853_c0_g1_i1.p1 TRINITY_DN853_c0_g1~~TRINITY_DN853_c0_g1_i1.p1  ORF type:complete len:576 (+),score=67.50 TRINITY_DN853_c0_g1_i1:482-2209(+)